MIPLVDLQTQYRSLKQEIDAAIQSVIASGQFILGKPVRDFEQEFAAAQGVKHCVAVGSGTDALHLALWASGLGPGDEVITTPHTFIATLEAILLTGARPVLVDIEESSFNIDASKIEAALSEKTKALLPVHLYGQPCDLDPLLHIASKYNLILIEDACQAHLAEYKGKKIGSFGRAAAFSFYPGKNLGAYGEAGAVVTNDSDLYLKMSKLRDHGQVEKYYHEYWGHNYRMEGIQGAVLRVKLKYLEKWTAARRRNASLYNEGLKALPAICTPAEMPYAKHVYHLYVIRSPRRQELKKHLEKKGISTGLHYPVPLHLQKAFHTLGYEEGDFPVTEKTAGEILSLPMYPELTEDQIQYVCDAIKEFFL